eukprot:TRINITY_DN7891_c0_g1_i4.p1 TRINITY_DN7891_c0_g1~~TRINITY_DN7891_c0_g1_i4.p1  ORF type:complete len:1088 (+),score=246.57 TRINITY_DN7891_c0_g1_i4:72-3335(+)
MAVVAVPGSWEEGQHTPPPHVEAPRIIPRREESPLAPADPTAAASQAPQELQHQGLQLNPQQAHGQELYRQQLHLQQQMQLQQPLPNGQTHMQPHLQQFPQQPQQNGLQALPQMNTQLPQLNMQPPIQQSHQPQQQQQPHLHAHYSRQHPQQPCMDWQQQAHHQLDQSVHEPSGQVLTPRLQQPMLTPPQLPAPPALGGLGVGLQGLSMLPQVQRSNVKGLQPPPGIVPGPLGSAGPIDVLAAPKLWSPLLQDKDTSGAVSESALQSTAWPTSAYHAEDHSTLQSTSGNVDRSCPPKPQGLGGSLAESTQNMSAQDRDILEVLQASGLALNLSGLLDASALPEQMTDWSQILGASLSGAQDITAGIPEVDAFVQRLSMPSATFPQHHAQDGPAEPVTQQASAGLRSKAMVAAEGYVAGYTPQLQTLRIVYPDGTAVNLPELASALRPTSSANAPHRPHVIRAMEGGVHVRLALQLYRSCDREGCGFLTWSSGSIRDFVAEAFRQLGLVPPSETQTYTAHTLFDGGRSMCLGARECICLVDALLRATFLFCNDSVDEERLSCTSPRTPSPQKPHQFAGSGAPLRGVPSSPVGQELAHARAETERLRLELDELRAAEAAAAAAAASEPPPEARAGVLPTEPVTRSARPAEATGREAQGLLSPVRDMEALVWTARAHAENRRLERELQNLRSLARKQCSEVQWMHDLKGQLSRHTQEEQEERRQKLELQELELHKQEVVSELEEQRLLLKERQLQQREGELQQEKELSLRHGSMLRLRELELSKELGRLKASKSSARVRAHSPSVASSEQQAGEPEEEADTDSSCEAAVQAASHALESKRLKRELESLRSLVGWQQTEVGASIARRLNASTPGARPAGEWNVAALGESAPETAKASQRKMQAFGKGALSMASLAGSALMDAAADPRADSAGEAVRARSHEGTSSDACSGFGNTTATDAMSCGHARSASQAITCAECGNVYMPDAAFCRKCGRLRSSSQAAQAATLTSSETRRQREGGAQQLRRQHQRQEQAVRAGIDDYERTVKALKSRGLARSDALHTHTSGDGSEGGDFPGSLSAVLDSNERDTLVIE